jgi:hypothetical protein
MAVQHTPEHNIESWLASIVAREGIGWTPEYGATCQEYERRKKQLIELCGYDYRLYERYLDEMLGAIDYQ